MICPRCGKDEARVMVKSPVGNVWEVYVCDCCYYSWRSTEEIHISEKFRLTEEKMEHMGVIPPVPPLETGE